MKSIAVAGTFDTKGKEFAYVKGLLEELGVQPFMIHTGVFEAAFPVDVNNDEIAAAVGQDIKASARTVHLPPKLCPRAWKNLFPNFTRRENSTG